VAFVRRSSGRLHNPLPGQVSTSLRLFRPPLATSRAACWTKGAVCAHTATGNTAAATVRSSGLIGLHSCLGGVSAPTYRWAGLYDIFRVSTAGPVPLFSAYLRGSFFPPGKATPLLCLKNGLRPDTIGGRRTARAAAKARYIAVVYS
jgi:hypothetical protein